MAARQGHVIRRARRPDGRWTLGASAPDWLRRMWKERSREVPRFSEVDLSRLRRIAYL